MTNTQANTITLDTIVDLARFVAELVRQGVTFSVCSERVHACADDQVWHVTLTGGF